MKIGQIFLQRYFRSTHFSDFILYLPKDNPIPQSIVGEKVNVTVPINDFTDGNKIILLPQIKVKLF